MTLKPLAPLIAAVTFVAGVPAVTHAHGAHPVQTAEGEGVVKAVNAKAATVTLAHGPIASLKWPAMTMTFQAASPAVLQGVKVGQPVHFILKSDNGKPVVVAVHAK